MLATAARDVAPDARCAWEGRQGPQAAVPDPRVALFPRAAEPVRAGARPLVRLPRKGLPARVLAIAALAMAVILFAVLNERRMRRVDALVPAAAPQVSERSWPAPPPLIIPSIALAPAAVPAAAAAGRATAASPAPLLPPSPRARLELAVPPPPHAPPIRHAPPPFAPVAPTQAAAPVVVDGGPRFPFPAAVSGALSATDGPERVRAAALSSPALTIVEGTLIPAVLETGCDSSRPGPVRAIVSRDVRSFDGSNILIPRGSRLIGESSSSASDGQHRMSIGWRRLIRPDGATIALDSPAADPQGRTGVPASANTHLLARLGNLVSTTLWSVGQFVAARASPLIVLSGGTSVPSGTRSAASKRPPTLKVAPGTSISVFVARDLEFSSASDRR